MTINTPLLLKALEHVTDHPEEHDQDGWAMRSPFCGTTYCLAGHVVRMTGHDIKWQTPSEEGVPGEEVASQVAEPVLIDGTTETRISVVAAHELGLDEAQADQLFLGCATVAELWALAYAYSNGEIQVPEQIKTGVSY